MTTLLFKKMVLSLLLATAVCFGGASGSAAADPALSKPEVEAVVRDYIANNPKAILDSISAYQKKTMEARQDGAVEKNRDMIFKDAGSPEVGDAAGDVTVVEFLDYNCHFCKSAFTTVQSLLEKDKKVRVIFKDFPILGPTSETAAKWVLAAKKQNKYFEFHTLLMNNKDPISDDVLAKMAKDLGLDVERMKKDAADKDIEQQIEKNRALASNMGISGTPAFIIGDEVVSGAIPLNVMEEKITALRNKNGKKK